MIALEALQGEFPLRTAAREGAAGHGAREVGDWPFAARLAQLMLEHDAAYAGTHYALALVAEHDGNTATAKREFDLAVKSWAAADQDLPELAAARKK